VLLVFFFFLRRQGKLKEAVGCIPGTWYLMRRVLKELELDVRLGAEM
jgi:hypothetical protein